MIPGKDAPLCPCTHMTPCRSTCTCASKFMSGGCDNCDRWNAVAEIRVKPSPSEQKTATEPDPWCYWCDGGCDKSRACPKSPGHWDNVPPPATNPGSAGPPTPVGSPEPHLFQPWPTEPPVGTPEPNAPDCCDSHTSKCGSPDNCCAGCPGVAQPPVAEVAIAAAHSIVGIIGTLDGVPNKHWSTLYLAVKEVCDLLRKASP